MIHFKSSFIFLAVLILTACSSNESDTTELTDANSQGKVQYAKTNLVVFFVPGMDQDIFSLLLQDPNSGNLRKFKNTGSYAPISYFEDYSDFNANATALMSGKTTLNSHLGIDKDSLPNKTWIEEFKDANYQISYISDRSLGSKITGAMFTGKEIGLPEDEKAVLNMVKFEPDFVWGMGTNLFKRRKDARNLFEELGIKNYDLSFDLGNIQYKNDPKFVGVFNNYAIPDSIDFVKEGLLHWTKIKDNGGHVLVLNILDLQGILNSEKKSELYSINRYIDFIINIEYFDPQSYLFLIINPFQDYERTFAISEGDTLNFTSKSVQYNQLNNNVWAFGKQSENFSGHYQNVDLYKKISDIIKNEPSN